MTDLSDKIFNDPLAAREHLETLRWPDGAYCPRCGEAEQIKRLGGKAGDQGQYNCRTCRKKFTVTVGTVFERSHIPLHKWMLATHLMASSKKGISAHQLHRMLGITYKTAWFMAHRIRETMETPDTEPMGGGGSIVEVDETYIGRDHIKARQTGVQHKYKIVTLVSRDGEARSFHVDQVNSKALTEIMRHHISFQTRLMTDQATHYKKMGRFFTTHETVNHSKHEYARGDVSTNTVEGFFSIFKRGMKGIYQHCGEQHLHRYVREFDFRYSNRKITDNERRDVSLVRAEGKRLTYRRTHEGPNA